MRNVLQNFIVDEVFVNDLVWKELSTPGLNPTNKKVIKISGGVGPPIFEFLKLLSYQKFFDIIFRNLAS